MSWLLMKNPGELDIRGLTHTGLSSKRDRDDQIGKYGSGWKHALARLLREDVGIRIFVGTCPVTVGKRTIEFRGTNHDEVLINRRPAGFTTGMGLDWELWMALREIYCNAIDEKGGLDTITDRPHGVEGETRVYVQMTKAVRDIYDQWDRYFAFDREKRRDFGHMAIYPTSGNGLTVYRRGVRVFYTEHKHALWDYEFRDIGINESRVVKSEWDVTWNIASMMKTLATYDMVNTLLWADRESIEWKMDWQYGSDTMSPAWIAYLEGYTVIPSEYAGHFAEEATGKHFFCPSSFCKWAHEYSEGKIKVAGCGRKPDPKRKPIEQSARHKTLLEDAIGFLKFGGFSDIDRFPIVIAEMDAGTLGEFKDGTVYLSNLCFDQGRRCVVETLLEEYGHGVSEAADETRAFQNVLLRFTVKAIEERTGKFL